MLILVCFLNPVVSQGVMEIAKCCPNLEVLVFSSCAEVGDDALGAILEHCSLVQEIEMGDSAMTDRSLDMAAQLRVKSRLRRLTVDGCVVTAKAVQRIQKAQPCIEDEL